MLGGQSLLDSPLVGPGMQSKFESKTWLKNPTPILVRPPPLSLLL